MADGISARVEGEGRELRLVVDVTEPDLAGKKATFKLVQHVKVKRSSPVHKSRVLSERDLNLRAGRQDFELPALPRDAYTYQGEDIDIALRGILEVDDGVFFDTELSLELDRLASLPPRGKAAADHKDVHSPKDSFNFVANLRAIPAKARLVVIWLMVVAGPIIAVNALVGARDQFVPDSQVWFYDHSGDDGSESPLMKSLAGSGGLGLVVWLAIRAQLKKYMSFEAQLPHGKLCRGGLCAPADVFKGMPRVALEEARVRLVAYNREHGQYTAQEKDGKSTKTVTKSFTTEARGIVLYEYYLPLVPAQMAVEGFLDGEIRFDPLFDALFPPMMVGDSHGLSVQLEAQLLHPEFVDHDVELPAAGLEVGDFYHRPAATATLAAG
jgi:hypothetical protein